MNKPSTFNKGKKFRTGLIAREFDDDFNDLDFKDIKESFVQIKELEDTEQDYIPEYIGIHPPRRPTCHIRNKK